MNKKTVFLKPNIIVSSCLGFERVRYNDQMLNDEWVSLLEKHVNFIQVCPEVAIGMGVPRFPIRIVSIDDELELVQPATNKKYGKKMIKFSDNFLSKQTDIDGCILKSRSPSCGLTGVKVYSEKSAPLGKRAGFFGEKVLQKYGDLAIEDEGRLKNLKIREHFLTKVFALAKLRSISKQPSPKALIDFHSNYKYILMAYSQSGLKKLGRIVANQKDDGIVITMDKYVKQFSKTLNAPAKKSNVINALMHMFGYFKKELTANEKKLFLESIELYQEMRIPLLSLTTLLRSWVIRYEKVYLAEQTIFLPFPEELSILADSGKMIDI